MIQLRSRCIQQLDANEREDVLDVILTDSVECGIIYELFTSLSLH